jgi:hypothetical protein
MIEKLTSKKLGKLKRQYYSLLQCLFGTLKPNHVTTLHVWFLPDYHIIKASPELCLLRILRIFPLSTLPFCLLLASNCCITTDAKPTSLLSRMALISSALLKYSIYFRVIASLIFGFFSYYKWVLKYSNAFI